MGMKKLIKRLAPAGTRRWQTAHQVKRLLFNWYFRRRYGWGPHLRSRTPNPYQPAAFNAFLARCGGAPFSWDPQAAHQDIAQASRVILGILQTRPDLRRQYPQALTRGLEGGFADWLRRHGPTDYGFTEAALRQVCQALAARPGYRIVQIYDHDLPLRTLMPLGFTPNGLECFVRHLYQWTKPHFGLRDEEIWWFLFERAEDPVHGLAHAYLRQPAWQRAHPEGLTAAGQAAFLRWIRTEFEIGDRWPDQVDFTSQSLPEMTQVNRHVDQGSGVNVLGHFCYQSGLRQATHTLVESLERAGIKASCRDLPGVREFETPDRDQFLGLERYPISLLVGAPTSHLVDPYELCGLGKRPGVHRIAYWYWELEDIPAEWAWLGREVQEIWAPTRFVAEALAKTMPGPVRHFLPGVELPPLPPPNRAAFGLHEDRFLFLFLFDMASIMERKNPLGLIRAYARAFRPDDRTQLVIKVSRGNYVPDDFNRLRREAEAAGVLILDRDLSRLESFNLIHACDAYVSLHRSEGFGLTMAEAMLMGKPVIATNYSGNLDFMTPENSLLVDYVKTPITRDLPIYRKGSLWAEPSIDHAAHRLRWAYTHPEEGKLLGLKAQRHMRQLLSLEAAGRRMADRIDQIGQKLARGQGAEINHRLQSRAG